MRGLHAPFQFTGVSVEIFNTLAGNPRIHRRLGDGGRDARQNARIKRLRDNVIEAVFKAVHIVGGTDFRRDRFLRQRGEGLGGGDLHGLVDFRGFHVKRAAEDVGETGDVVDLVRVVGAPGPHDAIGAGRLGVFIRDFRIRIRHGEQHRLVGHGAHHILRNQILGGKAEEQVRALHAVREAPQIFLLREFQLVFGQIRALLVNEPLGIEHADVPALYPQRAVEPRTGHARRAGPHHHDGHVFNPAAREFTGVEQGRTGNDGGAVLIVMEHRDAHFLLQRLLDDEAFRSFDVLKVDAAERGFHRPYGSDELFGAVRLEAQVEHVDIGEILEQDALTFHNRLGGIRPDVAEPEDGCAVGDHGHQVGAPGVFGHQRLILRDGLAGFRHTRRIGEGQILLAFAALGQHHFGFPVTGGTVVFKSFFPRKQGHVRIPY